MSPVGPEKPGRSDVSAPLHVEHHPVPVNKLWDVNVNVMPVALKTTKNQVSNFAGQYLTAIFKPSAVIFTEKNHTVVQSVNTFG